MRRYIVKVDHPNGEYEYWCVNATSEEDAYKQARAHWEEGARIRNIFPIREKVAHAAAQR